MKPKTALKGILVLALGLMVMGAALPAAAETVTLKLAHFMPTMHVQHRMAFAPFAKKVEELSGGEVKIKIYPGGSLGNPKTMVDAIRTGITDIGFVLPAYVSGRFPRCGVFDLPFLFNNGVHLTEVAYQVYDKQLAGDFKDFKVLWMLSSPPTQFQTVKKQIKSADDIKKLKIRTGGSLETVALKKLGANPVAMPISELSVSLQKGVIDGAVTPFAALKSHKLIDLVKYIAEVNMNGTMMLVLMNKRKWNSLSDKAKKAIDEASGKQMGLRAAKAFAEEDAENVKMAEGKIDIFKMPPAEMDKIRKTIRPMWEDWAKRASKRGVKGQEVLNAVLKAAEATR